MFGRLVRRIVVWAAEHRGLVQALFDALAWTAAIYVATWWRFEFDLGAWPAWRIVVAAGAAGALQMGAGMMFGLYAGRWRFGSFDEIAALTRSVAVVTVVLSLANRFLIGPRLLPVSVVLSGGVLGLVLMAGVRYSWRRFVERNLRPSADVAAPVLVYGAGEGGAQIVTAMLRNPESPYIPVGLIDDSTAKQQLRIMGVPVVGGREELAAAAAELQVRLLIIAIPSAHSRLLRQLSHIALEAGLDVRVLPPVHDSLDAGLGLDDLRPLDLRDLLGRREVQTDVAEIAEYLRGKKVLVTGAGGSIGSEICRQIDGFAPERLVMLDRDESALHAVQLSIEGHGMLDSPDVVIANIRDRDRIYEVFECVEPDVVFHAAALKHLPLLEQYPSEGVKTNVLGTLNVLDAAVSVGVNRFVNVSTDKAADPENVLGYTKRIAERLTAHKSSEAPGVYLSVRFGNVLGSRGSVLDTFRSQLDGGGPLTVTHPEVTRYFMTVEEAVQLVVQAGALGGPGEVLVLEMGQPVRIDDVARRLAADAKHPVDITYTGLRPGEKLHERLFGAGELDERPEHPMIAHVVAPPLARSDLYAVLGEHGTDLLAALRTLCAMPSHEAARRRRRPRSTSPLTTPSP